MRYLNIVRYNGGNELTVHLVPDQGHGHRDVGTEGKLVILADDERDLGHVLGLVLVKEHLVVNKARDADNSLDLIQSRGAGSNGHFSEHLTVDHDLLDLSTPLWGILKSSEPFFEMTPNHPKMIQNGYPAIA